MTDTDIRWKQRFANYTRALANLQLFVDKHELSGLNILEKQGIIQAFEYTHELAWNVLKDFLEEQGATGIFGSKNATQLAFRRELIEDGEIWMDMIKKRNLTSHTYNDDTAELIVDAILNKYFVEFGKLQSTLNNYL